MRKVITILLLLLFTVSAIPAAATPVDDLVNLAQYLPADAPVFIAIQTDDAIIDSIDGLFDTANTKFDGQLYEGDAPIRELLNEGATWIGGEDATFESLYRSWLGDSFALAATDVDTLLEGGSTQPFIRLFSVTDQEAAETFVDTYTSNISDYTKETLENGDILWTGENSWNTMYLLKEGVLFEMDSSLDLSILNVDGSLANSETFTNTLAMLPETDYSMLAYVDIPGIIEPFGMFAPMLLEDTPFADAPVQDILDAIGPEIYGITLTDDNSLIIDMVQDVKNPDLYATLGIDMMGRQPLDMSFTANVPGDSFALVHDQGLGTGLLFSLTMLEEVGKKLDEAGINFSDLVPENETEAQALLENFNVNDIATFARLSFKGMTGLTVDEAFSWMSEDYVSYLQFAESDAMELSVDGGMLVAVTDADAAQSTVDALSLFLEQNNVAFTAEDDALVISTLRDVVTDYSGTDDPALDVLVKTNGDIFAVGTRAGVEFALDPSDGGLLENPTFATASALFLPDPEAVVYLAFDPITAKAQELAQSYDDADLFVVANGLSLLDSASVTATTDADGNGYVRFVLTLKSE